MTRELTLRIVVEEPPSGVDFALQKGKGSAYEPVQKQRSRGSDLIFEFQPVFRSGVSSDGMSVAGPFVQGPPRQHCAPGAGGPAERAAERIVGAADDLESVVILQSPCLDLLDAVRQGD